MNKHTHSWLSNWKGPAVFLLCFASLHVSLWAQIDGTQYTTSTTLTVQPAVAAPGEQIILTSTTSGINLAGLAVSFFVDDVLVGKAVTDGTSVAKFVISPGTLKTGSHTAKAKFAGGVVRSQSFISDAIDGDTGRLICRRCTTLTITDTATASSGKISFTIADGPPVFRTQPTNEIVLVGSDVRLAPVVVGTQPLSYQWRLNGNPLPTATNATLTLTSVQPDQAGIYSVVVSNSLGTLTSSNASITVFTVSTSLPSTGTAIVKEGSDVTFTVSASSAVPLSYECRLDGGNFPGAKTPILSLRNVEPADAGDYSVVISDGVVSVTAHAAALSVRPEAEFFTLASSRSALDGQVQLTLNGKGGTDYTIEASSDHVLWTVLTNLSSPSGTLLVADSEAGRQPHRFYRGVITATWVPQSPNPNMVWIKPGTFTMGSPASEVDRSSDEGPQTQVTISHGFWMGKYEVTQAEYQAVVGLTRVSLREM